MFLSWICPNLRSKITLKGEYVFIEGDDVKCIFFNTSGSLGYCLPKYQNQEFIKIGKGNLFGVIDITGSMIEIFESDPKVKPDFDLWYDYMNKLRRIFSVASTEDHQMFILTLNDLYRMRTQFKEYYDEIFDDKFNQLQKLMAIKQNSASQCSKQ